MEIIKTDEDKKIETGVYKPDEKEQELICEVSDKVIDLIDSYNLTTSQRMFLLQCLVNTNNELNDILEVQLKETSENINNAK